jgi:hypothetical protein
MAGAVNPYFPTAPAAQPGHMHRPSHHLGPRSRGPPNRVYRDGTFRVSGPSWSIRQHLSPYPHSRGTSPSRSATPRVPMFQYPIPEHTLEEWKSRVMVDSYTALMLARATALSLKDSLEFPSGAISLEGNRETSQDTKAHILELASTLQDILGGAMDTASAMFPHKAAPPPAKGTLPRHLWPKSVRHDVAEIRRRAKTVRRLVRIVASSPTTPEDSMPSPTAHSALWTRVSAPPTAPDASFTLPKGYRHLRPSYTERPTPRRGHPTRTGHTSLLQRPPESDPTPT